MTVCHNEAKILPYFLAHYSQFAERILVWDDQSTDDTRKILAANPWTTVRDWPFDTGIDDEAFVNFAHAAYRIARGRADWLIYVDTDEFIYHPNILHFLTHNTEGLEVIQTCGFNMIGTGTGDGLPPFNGQQIYDRFPMGVRAPVYSKPVVIRPGVELHWSRGKHKLERCAVRLSATPLLKLLHYRYMGHDCTKTRNAKNYERCGLVNGDKAAAWTCAPGHRGEHSAVWADRVVGEAFNVLNSPLYV
jgi:hypothetical protein